MRSFIRRALQLLAICGAVGLGGLIWRVFGRFVGERDEAAHHRPTDEPDAADAFGPDALPSPAE